MVPDTFSEKNRKQYADSLLSMIGEFYKIEEDFLKNRKNVESLIKTFERMMDKRNKKYPSRFKNIVKKINKLQDDSIVTVHEIVEWMIKEEKSIVKPEECN